MSFAPIVNNSGSGGNMWSAPVKTPIPTTFNVSQLISNNINKINDQGDRGIIRDIITEVTDQCGSEQKINIDIVLPNGDNLYYTLCVSNAPRVSVRDLQSALSRWTERIAVIFYNPRDMTINIRIVPGDVLQQRRDFGETGNSTSSVSAGPLQQHASGANIPGMTPLKSMASIVGASSPRAADASTAGSKDDGGATGTKRPQVGSQRPTSYNTKPPSRERLLDDRNALLRSTCRTIHKTAAIHLPFMKDSGMSMTDHEMICDNIIKDRFIIDAIYHLIYDLIDKTSLGGDGTPGSETAQFAIKHTTQDGFTLSCRVVSSIIDITALFKHITLISAARHSIIDMIIDATHRSVEITTHKITRDTSEGWKTSFRRICTNAIDELKKLQLTIGGANGIDAARRADTASIVKKDEIPGIPTYKRAKIVTTAHGNINAAAQGLLITCKLEGLSNVDSRVVDAPGGDVIGRPSSHATGQTMSAGIKDDLLPPEMVKNRRIVTAASRRGRRTGGDGISKRRHRMFAPTNIAASTSSTVTSRKRSRSDVSTATARDTIPDIGSTIVRNAERGIIDDNDDVMSVASSMSRRSTMSNHRRRTQHHGSRHARTMDDNRATTTTGKRRRSDGKGMFSWISSILFRGGK